jgi:cephalosporin hydroxylase
MKNPIEEFKKQGKAEINVQKQDKELTKAAREFGEVAGKYNYPYHFSWMGTPILQLPQDMMAMQELIWEVKPDLIIETGIAYGGSLIFYASMLELLQNKAIVIGIDIDIRKHNRTAIEKHSMYKNIKMIEGSSVDLQVVEQVKEIANDRKKIMVVLDSFHTHEHVLEELKLYSPFVTKESYLVVYDTIVEELPEDSCSNRPWGKGNNPKTAVDEFLSKNHRFIVDDNIDGKVVLTAAPGGYLKCVKE